MGTLDDFFGADARPGKNGRAVSRPARADAPASRPAPSNPDAAAASSDASSSPPSAPSGPQPISVTTLILRIKNALASAFPQRIAVVGEISNLKLHTSGHIYFRIKDNGAAIDAAMWRASASRLKFRPADGMEVVVEGKVDVYDVRGQLQLYVERMTPRGAGALELAFRQLYEKLQKEGLFDAARKIPLPPFPRAVGLVTSATGAAVRDIIRTLRHRWPAVRVYLVPVLVQGEGAAEDIADALARLDACASRFGIDTIILARGGGSLEDLWAFNEEIVARAIYACNTPIVCGVGHEVDTTIADLVSDVRAPTPTGAAELAVPEMQEVRKHLAHLAQRLEKSVADDVRSARAALMGILRSVVFRDPAWRVRVHTQRADELQHRLLGGLRQALSASRRRLEPAANRLAALHPARLAERARARLERAVSRLAWVLGGASKRSGDKLATLEARLGAVSPLHALELARQRVTAAERQLEAMSYRSVLRRGYSVTRGADGAILRTAADVVAGAWIETELADGTISSQVGGLSGKPADKPAETPVEKPVKKKPEKKHTDDDELTLF